MGDQDKEKLEQARQEDAAGSWGKRCIYRVPQYLGDGDDKAYIPQTVSLGPYHHGKRCHRNMDRHKWRSFYHILKPTNQDIKLYLDSMKELEERARACYEGTIPLSSNEFVEMIVLDGCFILELFRGAAEGFIQIGYCRNDPVFAMRGSMQSIQRDMIMLENQIPPFALDRLLGLQFGQPNQKGLVAKLALRFFDPLMPTDEPLTKSVLRVSGIKFRKKKTDRFWDVTFNNGILGIPRLLIHDGTKSLFLNLIAFEQCHLNCCNEITSYVIFMDNLINSAADVAYLHYCGIIEHWLVSDAEFADLFNRLCQEVVFDINDSYLSPMSAEVKPTSWP